MIKKGLLLILFAFIQVNLFAQQNAGNEVEMADIMRSNGKIYVVVGVVTFILTGLLIYLISLDLKIRKLESRVSGNSKNEIK